MKVNLVRVGGAIIAISSIIFGWIAIDARIESDRAQVRLEEFVRCQVAVTDQIVTVLTARTAFAEKDRVALRQVFLEVSQSKSSKDTLAALNRYNTAIALTDEERAAAKLPAPPSRACDRDHD